MDLRKNPVFINISAMSVVKIIMILILFYFLFVVKEILAILFVSLILASGIDPWVDWMQSKKIPRGIGVLFIYLVILFVVASAFVLIVPPIVVEVGDLREDLPLIIDKMESGLSSFRDYSSQYSFFSNIEESLSDFAGNIPGAASGIFTTLKSFIGSIFSFFIILVITFYMVVEEKAMKKIVWSIAPSRYQLYIMDLVNRMQQKIGLWLRGQLILSFIIFLLTYIGLSVLGVEYALVLALIAGLTEFVPYLGPTLAAIPAIFLAFTQAPLLAVFVAVMYYIIQLTENNIIVPKLMQKVVGLNPIVSIAVLLIGFKIGGIPGAILSIPVTTAASVFLNDIFEDKIRPEEAVNKA